MTETKYVPISKEDTYRLILAAQRGDQSAKTRLVEQNTGLVKKLTLKFSSTDCEQEDLMQIGFIGLLKAISKFDVKYDVMFSTYAVPIILGEIKRYFRDNGKIKAGRSLKSDIYNMKKLQDEHLRKTGKQMRLSELSDAMNISVDEVVEIIEADNTLSNVASLDNPDVKGNLQRADEKTCPETQVNSIVLKMEIEKLDKTQKKIMKMRYYDDMTQKEIAGELGISQVQVSRLEKKAVEIIKNNIEI